MQRVADLKTEPVVGRTYLVTCVPLYVRDRIRQKRRDWIPVLGPRHEDRDFIDFPHSHWHYDLRFVPEWYFGPTAATRPCGAVSSADFTRVLVRSDGPVRIKRRKCLRRMPRYPAVELSFLPALEFAYAAATVTVTAAGCRLCPHRGLPLDGLPPEPGGVVTCRGHGLRWGADGKLVPR
jgi:hypothetical protein